MIEVHCGRTHITVKGHAGFSDPGTDIVCAAVSALLQTMIQSVEELTNDEIKYDISPGWADVYLGNLSSRGRVLRDSFFLGCQMIAEEYPYNVQIV